MTTIKLNRDEICRLCGNRGGIDGSIAYAGADAVAKIIGGELGVFRADEDTLYVAEWEYASGTYRAEPTRVRHQVRVMDVGGEHIAAEGEFSVICVEAMRKCLTENVERIKRRGGEVGSNDPIDVGFDPSLHITM